jgi:putative peptidoglycan lipid II flippase
MAEENTIARPAGTVAFYTLLSRILGLARDMVVAFSFGAASHADAFFVAFRIPNMLRRMVAEGALTAAFLPVYVDSLEKQGPEEGRKVVDIVFTVLTLVLVVLTLAGVALSPWVIRLFAPGFLGVPGKFELAVSLNRIVFPYIFFVSLVALCMGVLNANGHFSAPAASPILLNVFMILGAVGFSRWCNPPIYGLAVGVLAGGLFQFLLQVPALESKGVRFRPNLSFRHPAVRRIGLLFLPAALGAAVYQLNLFVSNVLASFLPEGSISYLWYSSRLLEFPLGVFGMALATAAFPSLSQQSSRRDASRFFRTFEDALSLITFATLPAMVGLMVLGRPIVEVLFQRGAFDALTTRGTADALLYYATGMWPIAAGRILVSAFHSVQDTRTPVKLSLVSFVANVVLSLLLMGPMLHCGLALANSLSAVLNTAMLFVCFRSRMGGWGLGWVRNSGGRVILASGMMGLALSALKGVLGWEEAYPFARKCLLLGLWVVAGGGVYIVGCLVLRVRELDAFMASLRARCRRPNVLPPGGGGATGAGGSDSVRRSS